MSHTPGPWGCVDTSNHAHDYRLTKPSGDPLPLHVEANDHSEQRANAKLIAAAPKLLKALQLVVEYHVPKINPFSDASILSAISAINEATEGP